jgi:hypothetical protein
MVQEPRPQIFKHLLLAEVGANQPFELMPERCHGASS